MVFRCRAGRRPFDGGVVVDRAVDQREGAVVVDAAAVAGACCPGPGATPQGRRRAAFRATFMPPPCHRLRPPVMIDAVDDRIGRARRRSLGCSFPPWSRTATCRVRLRAVACRLRSILRCGSCTRRCRARSLITPPMFALRCSSGGGRLEVPVGAVCAAVPTGLDDAPVAIRSAPRPSAVRQMADVTRCRRIVPTSVPVQHPSPSSSSCPCLRCLHPKEPRGHTSVRT